MNKKKTDIYSSPELEVIEVQMQTVTCKSNTSPVPVDDPYYI